MFLCVRQFAAYNFDGEDLFVAEVSILTPLQDGEIQLQHPQIMYIRILLVFYKLRLPASSKGTHQSFLVVLHFIMCQHVIILYFI